MKLGFNRYLIVLILGGFSLQSMSQPRFDTLGWRPPVDIPITLTGNFGELRADHFHAGIDIKTQGHEGLKIYAVQDGYISRIKISPVGYGKSIYITHADGYTSVYAHLKELNIQLEKYIRKVQYQRESFDVDVFPEPNELPVKKGEIVALSGNSGSSGGPHLHFEIRETKSSKPMNGLFLGYKIPDHLAPKMSYLYVYPQDNSSWVENSTESQLFSLQKLNNRYKLRHGDTLQANGNIGLGIKADDLLDGATNLCGVYQFKVLVDDSLYFMDQFDGVSFSESRYVNSLMDYEEFVENKRKLYKLYVEPNNKLSIYQQAKNQGTVFVKPGKVSKISVQTYDAYKNKSELVFYLEGNKKKIASETQKNVMVVPWQEPFRFDSSGVVLKLPSKSLYDTLHFEFSIDNSFTKGLLSPVFNIHRAATPIHEEYSLSLPYKEVADTLKDKLLMVFVDGEKLHALGGTAVNGKVEAQLRGFGPFAVSIDTVAPVIKPKNGLAKNKDLTSAKKIQFEITDNLSGIKNIQGTINGKWVLFEWDPKNDLLSYEMDENTPKQGAFEVKVVAVDAKGNKAIYQTTCNRNVL